MCMAWLQAMPSQARLKSWPDHSFGLAQNIGEPKPSAQATAFELIFWSLGEHLVNNFTSGYPIDPSVRWYLVVSEFHLIDRF